MSANIIPFQTKAEAAWQDYVLAATKAQRSLQINDGIEAGNAYRRFLELFLTDGQKAVLGGRK